MGGRPTDPDGPPFRPNGAIWVSLRTGLIHVDLAPDGAEVTLSLPLLLEAEAGLVPAHLAPAALPRVAERESVRIARLLEGRSLESLEAVNAELGDWVKKRFADLLHAS